MNSSSYSLFVPDGTSWLPSKKKKNHCVASHVNFFKVYNEAVVLETLDDTTEVPAWAKCYETPDYEHSFCRKRCFFLSRSLVFVTDQPRWQFAWVLCGEARVWYPLKASSPPLIFPVPISIIPFLNGGGGEHDRFLSAAEWQMHGKSTGQAAIPSSAVAGWRQYE